MKAVAYILIIAMLPGMFSCIGDVKPHNNTLTKEQIQDSPQALDALSESVATCMYAFQQFGLDNKQEYGYPAQMRIKDALLDDYPNTNKGFDYMRSPWASLSKNLAEGNAIHAPWRFYYSLIFNAHNIILAIDQSSTDKDTKAHLGNAYLYRALAYFDLVRMYEYKRTGITSLDDEADRNNLWGLTVPLVTESTTGEETLNNPRRMFYEMYRFILTDLNRAENYLDGYERLKKNRANVVTVYAYKARFWLELATRFRLKPADLSAAAERESDTALKHLDPLGITSSEDCYTLAAEYARKVIDSGYLPLTESEWHDIENGFNSSSSPSWVFAVIIPGPDAVKHAYYSFIGQICQEYDQGVGRYIYNTVMISKSLFDNIGDADWRKSTWIAPEDAGKAPDRNKYATLLTDGEWSQVGKYANFKFRPKGGNRSDYRAGGAMHLPLVRVEEMYFIEIEALAFTKGIGSGSKALESFINTFRYRDASYRCDASDEEEFIRNHLILHKRIEFWGEGVLYYDYKRLNLPVVRGYPGTNYIDAQRYNSDNGYCVPWLNMYFPRSGEALKNKGLIQNPDPKVSANISLWVE